jgi:hypothetical protein
VPDTVWVDGKFPTSTVPETACVEGKLFTPTDPDIGWVTPDPSTFHAWVPGAPWFAVIVGFALLADTIPTELTPSAPPRKQRAITETIHGTLRDIAHTS